MNYEFKSDKLSELFPKVIVGVVNAVVDDIESKGYRARINCKSIMRSGVATGSIIKCTFDKSALQLICKTDQGSDKWEFHTRYRQPASLENLAEPFVYCTVVLTDVNALQSGFMYYNTVINAIINNIEKDIANVDKKTLPNVLPTTSDTIFYEVSVAQDKQICHYNYYEESDKYIVTNHFGGRREVTPREFQRAFVVVD